MKLSILIPLYNEEKTISILLNKLMCLSIEHEIIIVNDCSTDSSELIILNYMENNALKNIKYQKQLVNSGKGAAIHKGIELASGDYIIIQDADLEYNPQDYNLLFEPILLYDADVVYGSRFIGGNSRRVMFFWHTIGNRFLTFFSNITTGFNLTDMETCYKVFKKEVIKNLILNEQRFGFEPEVTAKISKIINIKLYEVGISYNGRTYAEGKKINWKDGIRAIYVIIKYAF